MPSIGKNLQPFTGNGDFSIRVKNSRVGRISSNKQIETEQMINCNVGIYRHLSNKRGFKPIILIP